MGKTKKSKSTKTQNIQSFWQRHRRLKRWLVGILVGIVLLVGAAYVAFQVSPWPNSLLIRYEFDKNGQKVSKALEKYVPGNITEIQNQPYKPGSKDGFLDVFYADQTTETLPTIVWVHGGGWVSGDKDEVDNYLKILASYGFTTVGVDYTIAPDAQYPTPILQLNDALTYLQQNAQRLHINSDKLVLAGDSAGSQIVAQMANIITSPAYASEMSIKPTLAANKLRATLLNCGAYDLALPDYSGPFGKFLHTVLWAYSGKKDFLHDPALQTASVANYVTKDFPPSFITAGNGDPLESQSTEFAKRLSQQHVPVSTLFYPADHKPTLPHEYQFNLDQPEGHKALAQMVQFLHQRMQ